MNKQASIWIRNLGLKAHPEGGYYRETYRASGSIRANGLPARFAGPRSFATAIYFLLEGRQRSVLHRIRSDEVWHFYCGAVVVVHMISPDGTHSKIRLGRRPCRGEVLQAVVPAGCWFGAGLAGRRSYALVGCTVSPGFDFRDFELGRRSELLRKYPRHRALIEELTNL
ncbi:MAG: cupin domain-containing protein [bacterium]